jgi:hypothetical protein
MAMPGKAPSGSSAAARRALCLARDERGRPPSRARIERAPRGGRALPSGHTLLGNARAGSRVEGMRRVAGMHPTPKPKIPLKPPTTIKLTVEQTHGRANSRSSKRTVEQTHGRANSRSSKFTVEQTHGRANARSSRVIVTGRRGQNGACSREPGDPKLLTGHYLAVLAVSVSVC